MVQHSELISTPEQISELAKALENQDVIAFDTEFIRESTFFPIVEIIQIATEDESWLVDAQTFKRKYSSSDPKAYDPAIEPLLSIFSNKKILKIAHASQGDQECLFTSFGVVATPTLDTAVAASLCGYGDGIGLGKLLKVALDVTLKKGHARTNWSVRPLPQQLMDYAHADVEHLVKLGKILLNRLETVGRKEWAFALSAKWEDKSLYETDIEGMTQKLARGGKLDSRGCAVLRELVKWREERVRHLNLPRRWVADDHVLIDLAHVRPKDIAHLGAFRGLNKGELKASGEAILAAIRSVSEEEGRVSQKVPKTLIPTPEEVQALDLIRCYIGILADRHKIAAKHVMTSAQFLPLLRSHCEKPDDLVAAGILTAEAAALVGSELIAMIQGKRALMIRRNHVDVMNMDQS